MVKGIFDALMNEMIIRVERPLTVQSYRITFLAKIGSIYLLKLSKPL